jgi:hypothetical protein
MFFNKYSKRKDFIEQNKNIDFPSVGAYELNNNTLHVDTHAFSKRFIFDFNIVFFFLKNIFNILSLYSSKEVQFKLN